MGEIVLYCENSRCTEKSQLIYGKHSTYGTDQDMQEEWLAKAPAHVLWTHLTLDREDTCSAIHAGSDTRISACCSWEEMAGACMGGVRCEDDAGLLRIRTLTRFTHLHPPRPAA